MIVCGWCARLTANRERCTSCGHEDPPRPWAQRGVEPPEWHPSHGRPRVTPTEVARRLADARRELGDRATVERLAEHLDVSPRTVRRWQKVSG